MSCASIHSLMDCIVTTQWKVKKKWKRITGFVLFRTRQDIVSCYPLTKTVFCYTILGVRCRTGGMADAGDSKSPARKGVPVQVRGPVLKFNGFLNRKICFVPFLDRIDGILRIMKDDENHYPLITRRRFNSFRYRSARTRQTCRCRTTQTARQ